MKNENLTQSDFVSTVFEKGDKTTGFYKKNLAEFPTTPGIMLVNPVCNQKKKKKNCFLG